MSTQEYRELRVLIEDLVSAWPAPIASAAVDQARAYLRIHCRECGERLSDEQIEQRRELCPRCRARLPW